jgi:hypothetical protein
MPGPSRAGRLERRIFPRNLSHLAVALAVCLLFVVGESDCGFPEYDFITSAGAGASAGSGGGSGAAAGSSGDAGASAGFAGSGGTAQAGAAGTGGAAGAACVFPAPVVFPAHCFDNSVNDDETGLNCGGSECVPCSGAQACATDSDCASDLCTSAKTCSPILSLTYMSIVADAFTRTPKFNLTINYAAAQSTPLQDLRIRYYFNHDGVAEPVIALDTQVTFDPGNSQRDISGQVSYQIHRYPSGPADSKGIITDSYLEITFSSNASLAAGSTLNLTQDIVAGSSDSNAEFQQSTHYSFINASSPIANNAITVYRGDQLLWGVPPPMNLLPDCAFAAGVNLNGPAVSSDGQALQSSADAAVSFSGATFQNTELPLPATDSGTATLLSTGFTLGSASATWPVPNGKYWVYAWLSSNVSAGSGQLMIQDNPADEFFGLQRSGSAAWARIGPYSLDVLSGSVKLSGSGVVNIAGVELYRVAP